MKLHRRLLVPLALLGALLLFDALFTPGFFHLEMRDGRLFGSIVDVLNRAAPVMLLSVGMTLVIATGGVDLSVGAVMAIAGATAACLIARPDGCILNALPTGGSVVAVIAFGLAAALLCGLFNGVLVSWFNLQPIVATLLLMVAGRGVAQLLTDGQIVTFTNPGFAAMGSGSFLALPIPVWLALLAFVTIGILTRVTAYGLLLESVGNNAEASRLSGIDARKVKLVAYAVSGIGAGIAGLIATADIRGADANNAGLYLELDAILAVALGGTSMSGGRFSLAGSMIGAVLMQTLTTTIFARGVSPEIALVLKAAIVVVVCILQSGRVRALSPGRLRGSA